MKKILSLLATVLLLAAAILTFTIISYAEEGEPAVVATGDVFEYVSGGVTKRADAEFGIGNVVSAADAGSTIKLLSDYTVESSIDGALAKINKKLTLDLGGHTFTIRDKYENATNIGQPSIHISTTQGFTVKNGTLVAGHVTSAHQNKAYPFFLMAANKAVLNLENVNTYVGTIAYNWGSEQVVMNISGGEHHAYFSGYGCDGGLFNSRSGITVNVEEAKINVASNSWLIASMHQNADADKRSSVFTFNNCTINTETDTTQIVKYASEYTEVYFNNCRIDGGIIKPTVTSGESNKGIGSAKDGSIIFGSETVFSEALDYDSRVAPAEGNVIVNKTALIQSSFRFASGNFYTGFSIGSSTITKFFTAHSIVDASTLKSATVRWYDKDGNLITTTEAGVGSYVTPITLEEYAYDSYDWYDVVYDGWSKTPGGKNESSILVEGDVSLYQTHGSVRARITGAMYNLSLMGHVQTNIYIPATLPDNVKILGVYRSRAAAESNVSSVGYVIAKNAVGDRYRCYTAGWAGACELGTANEVWVKLSVEHDGKTSEVYQSYSLSALAYIKAMLADSELEKPAYAATAHEMTANIVRYSYVLADTVGKAQNADVVSLYNKYSTVLCKPIDNTTDEDFPAPEVSLGATVDYLESITFEVSSYQPRYRISFKKDAHVTDAKLSLTGWYAAAKGKPNWMEQVYNYSEDDVLYYDSLGQYVNSAGKVTDQNGTVQNGKTAGTLTGEIAVAFFEAIQIYNIDSDMTISLTLSNGSVVKGQYNIDYYYNGIKESVGNDMLLKVRNFLKVMREYGDSVERHAFDTGKVPLDAMETKTVNYMDFGAVGDGVTNDFDAIKKTHEYANEMGYKVEADPDATYYIGRTYGQIIEIKTDTDWCGATFIIDDTVYEVSDPDRSKHIFCIASSNKTMTYTAVANNPVGQALININKAGGLKADSFTTLDLGLGYPALVYLINENHNSYIRYGENQDAGSAQRELVKINEKGEVDESTPLLFDYDEVTKIQVVRTDDDPIVVGYGNFITKANAAPRQYTYYYRGINIQRSNTTLTDIDHKIVGEGDTGAPYSGFVSASYCDSVMVLDSVLSAHKAYLLEGDDHNTMGSYDLSPGNLNDFYVYNVTMHNFFGPDGVTPSVNCGWWGVMGSNYCKNLTYDSCKLTRFDAHCGTYNATIRNSEVGTLTLIGGGLFTLENSIVHAATRGNIISLRSDYGSTWRGEFYLKDVTVVSTTFNGTTMAIMNGTHTNWNFGYECYMPEKVTVDNLVCTAPKVNTIVLANGSITNEGISNETINGSANLNPYAVTKTLIVKNNKKGYTYTLPGTNTYLETEIVSD